MMAREAMLNALRGYKPVQETAERGIDLALKIRDSFVEAENEKEGIFTFEVETNDLMGMIRTKVQS
jgi:hypothetical protein